jgi:hypothetical protein
MPDLLAFLRPRLWHADSATTSTVTTAPATAEPANRAASPPQPGSPSGRGGARSDGGGGSESLCLICFEPIEPADLESGEALRLDCQCRGDAALRHRSCAIKWTRIKV